MEKGGNVGLRSEARERGLLVWTRFLVGSRIVYLQHSQQTPPSQSKPCRINHT